MGNVVNLSTSILPAPISWVESLFARMQGMYGNKFLDMWRDTDVAMVKALWADEMGKLSNDELKRGYAALMKRDWPPSLPEYVKMCKPSIDPTVAYYEAIAGVQARSKGEMGKWSSPAIFWAAVPLSFDLGQQTYSQIKTRWEKALAEQLDKGEWAEIPEPMIQLAAPGNTKSDREKATQVLTEIGAADVLKPKTDHKLWAKRIIERAKKQNNGLSAIQIRFAKEAMAASSV